MASKRRVRRKACSSKIRYKTLGEALQVRYRMGDKTLNAYGCKYCGGFHLGHPSKRIRQSIAAKRERQGPRI